MNSIAQRINAICEDPHRQTRAVAATLDGVNMGLENTISPGVMNAIEEILA